MNFKNFDGIRNKLTESQRIQMTSWAKRQKTFDSWKRQKFHLA